MAASESGPLGGRRLIRTLVTALVVSVLALGWFLLVVPVMALPDDRYGEDTAKPVIAGVFGTSGLSLGGEGLYGDRVPNGGTRFMTCAHVTQSIGAVSGTPCLTTAARRGTASQWRLRGIRRQ